MYSRQILRHFRNPRNVGSLKRPDGVGRVGNPLCGDIMEIYLKISKKKGKEIIKNIKFKTFGCPVAIACSSVLTELAKGKTLQEAQKIKNTDVAKKLGQIPAHKFHCSVLAADALKAAIKDYLEKSN